MNSIKKENNNIQWCIWEALIENLICHLISHLFNTSVDGVLRNLSHINPENYHRDINFVFLPVYFHKDTEIKKNNKAFHKLNRP